MYPGKDPEKVAEILAAFFNNISDEYEPLKRDDIPKTFDRELPLLSCEDVAKKMISAKKPTSWCQETSLQSCIQVPQSTCYPRHTCVQSHNDYKMLTSDWKTEHITIIPKYNDPQEPGECRNIACTNFLSKLYKSVALSWSRELFFSILLTHKGSHREVYRDFQPSLTSSAGGAKG